MASFIGSVPSGDFWTGIGALAFSIFTGGLAMAWRLGRLEQQMSDAKDDIDAVERRVETYLMRSWIEKGKD